MCSQMEDLAEQKAIYEERYTLAFDRIREISTEQILEEPFAVYFRTAAEFILLLDDQKTFLEQDGLQTAPLEELQRRNRALYEAVLPDAYENSFLNPAYAVKKLGDHYGQALSFLMTELRSMIGFAYEGRIGELVIRMELFVEVYGTFVCEQEENGKLPEYATIQQILYWFVSDYADEAAEQRTRELTVSRDNFAANIIMNSDLMDVRYLYFYGEYISDNELQMARFMAGLSQDTINTMADTYTEGYRMGFVMGNKDLSKKKTVELRYQLGFERMMKRAVENFRTMGLEPVIYRAASSILYNPSLYKVGFFGGTPNRQYEFDHKDDKALFLDKNYVNRRLEVSRTAFEEYKEEALGYAGPAVVETFGEKEFEPVNKPENLKLSEEQNALWVEYRTKAGEIQRNYILEEERSFTIIAFPIPEIGDCFEELFRETIRINTLDYKLYQSIQQTMIDTLDTAAYCEIKGKGENRTDLHVELYKLNDPSKETIFENCVADVNIPVGEVFTSPVLTGTNGVLHVSHVYLNGLEFKNLEIVFRDGLIAGYHCANFDTEEENKNYIRDNILFRHETLPMGEFAIGTNTTAYEVAGRMNVGAKLPILIAEKTGPHFAVGDTCYSHAESVRVYNPDGKEIVAKDNEKSLLRNVDPSKAYFNCHTDITIPFEELGELTAVRADGRRIPIILDGQFVLPGTEKLNEPLNKGK